MKTFIIADDVTGMLDTGAQFAGRGISTEILPLPVDAERIKSCHADVAVTNAGTRHLTAPEAYRIIRQLSQAAREAGVPILFKKTDSALRGHIGSELAAMSDAFAGKAVAFFPAYPELGRITKNGIQYVGGVPLSESAFSRDPLEPATESMVSRILARETGIPCFNAEETAIAPGQKILLFDGETEEEMARRVHAVLAERDNGQMLFAGCAGLAKVLAREVAPIPKKTQYIMEDNLFVLCGTNHAVTTGQIRYAQEHGFRRYSVPLGALIRGKADEGYAGRVQALRQLCRQGEPLIVDIDQQNSTPVGLEDSRKIVDGLNQMLLACMDELKHYTLFLTGGDTLDAFLQRSGCQQIAVLGEILPGTPVNRLTLGDQTKYVISKSGGYGQEDVLIACANKLRKLKKETRKT